MRPSLRCLPLNTDMQTYRHADIQTCRRADLRSCRLTIWSPNQKSEKSKVRQRIGWKVAMLDPYFSARVTNSRVVRARLRNFDSFCAFFVLFCKQRISRGTAIFEHKSDLKENQLLQGMCTLLKFHSGVQILTISENSKV